MTKVHMTAAEQFKASKLIEENLKPTEGGLFFYTGTWTDKKIAEAVSPRLSDGHVRHLRQQLFGNLVTTQGGRTKLDALIVNFNTLCERLGAIELKVE